MGINLKPTQALSNFSPRLKKAWLVEKSDWGGGVAVHVIVIPSREKKRVSFSWRYWLCVVVQFCCWSCGGFGLEFDGEMDGHVGWYDEMR